MSYVADLHLHSPYAYATSRALTLENLTHWAKLKGIDLLASADFTHPVWFQELRDKLEETSGGLYQFQGVNFILGTEVSCVYSQDGRQRRLHLLLFAPDLDTVARINTALASYGRLSSDGRPTLMLSARDLTALVLDIDPACIVIPAHVWTPWYGAFGSKSGFETLKGMSQTFGGKLKQIEDKIEELKAELRLLLESPERTDKTLELRSLVGRHRLAEEIYNSAIGRQQAANDDAIHKELQAAVRELAQKRGILLVLRKHSSLSIAAMMDKKQARTAAAALRKQTDQNRNRSVLYSAEGMDITEDVIKILKGK